ncbi:hypothetical protein MMC20_006404 [Loxospora ochrophaea]|nr:hypothetical protein [Loxospora ochrophaea]
MHQDTLKPLFLVPFLLSCLIEAFPQSPTPIDKSGAMDLVSPSWPASPRVGIFICLDRIWTYYEHVMPGEDVVASRGQLSLNVNEMPMDEMAASINRTLKPAQEQLAITPKVTSQQILQIPAPDFVPLLEMLIRFQLNASLIPDVPVGDLESKPGAQIGPSSSRENPPQANSTLARLPVQNLTTTHLMNREYKPKAHNETLAELIEAVHSGRVNFYPACCAPKRRENIRTRRKMVPVDEPGAAELHHPARSVEGSILPDTRARSTENKALAVPFGSSSFQNKTPNSGYQDGGMGRPKEACCAARVEGIDAKRGWF